MANGGTGARSGGRPGTAAELSWFSHTQLSGFPHNELREFIHRWRPAMKHEDLRGACTHSGLAADEFQHRQLYNSDFWTPLQREKYREILEKNMGELA